MKSIIQIEGFEKTEFIAIIKSIFEEVIEEQSEQSKPKFASVQELSKLLNISEMTVYNYIKKGIIPARKIGRQYRLDVSEIEEYLKEYKSLKYKRNL